MSACRAMSLFHEIQIASLCRLQATACYALPSACGNVLVRGALSSFCHDAQVAREASKRVLGLRPFDVQLIGAMILHRGEIAEMRTGEGKTLVAVLPAYLNALSGRGVQVYNAAVRPLGYSHHLCDLH